MRAHPTGSLEALARSRLRGLREARGWSLDDLPTRTHMSAATLSRIETGRRSLILDVLGALADSLQVDVRTLFDAGPDEDVVIRPTPTSAQGRTVWPLTRPGAGVIALKIRIEPEAATSLKPGATSSCC